MLRLTKYMLVLALCALVLACAAGKKHYETGMQLAEYGKYQEAIAYLEQAIAAEPKNEQYKQELAKLKSNLIGQYVDEANQALSATPVNIAAIDKARQALNMAQEVDANAPEVQKLAEDIKTKETVLLGDVKQLYAQAQQAIASNEWTKAYFALQQIQSKFPNYEKSSQLLAQTSREGSEYYMNTAREFFKQEEFTQSINYLRQALSLNSGNDAARKMLMEAQKNNSKGYFIQQGNDARVANNWDRAVQMYERALGYDQTDAKLAALIGHVKLKAGEFYVQDARAKMEEGWLLKAIQTMELAEKYLNKESDFMLSALRNDLIKRAKLIAETFKEEEKYGGAWYWYEQIKTMDSAYPNIFFLIQEMQDRIKQRVQKSIAVFDFNSPSNNSDAGIIVANNLITFLFNNASGDIKILERENLKSILEEMKLGQIGVVTENTAKEMGRIYGIDVAIMGSVLVYRVDSSVSEGVKSVRYQIGEEISDNIEYLNWKARNPDPSKEDLKNAPPAKLVTPKFVEKDYAVAQHKKVGFVQLSFRIVDVSTGENIQVRTIKKTKTVEDVVSAGVPEAKIKYDPLKIATDTELIQELTDDVVSEMGREALRPLRSLEQNYFKEAENFIRRRENLLAAEKFVDSVFDEKMKGVNTPISANAQKRLEEIFLKYRVSL